MQPNDQTHGLGMKTTHIAKMFWVKAEGKVREPRHPEKKIAEKWHTFAPIAARVRQIIHGLLVFRPPGECWSVVSCAYGGALCSY